MDAETLRWLTGIIIGNVFFAAAAMYIFKILLNRAKHIELKQDRTIFMHENPDDHGFGTAKLSLSLEETRRSQESSNREMVHYFKWLATQIAGKAPPPFIDKGH